MFFIDTFQKRTFPPLDIFPDLVLLDVVLEVDFLSLVVHKVVGEGEHHKLFGVVSVELLGTLS